MAAGRWRRYGWAWVPSLKSNLFSRVQNAKIFSKILSKSFGIAGDDRSTRGQVRGERGAQYTTQAARPLQFPAPTASLSPPPHNSRRASDTATPRSFRVYRAKAWCLLIIHAEASLSLSFSLSGIMAVAVVTAPAVKPLRDEKKEQNERLRREARGGPCQMCFKRPKRVVARDSKYPNESSPREPNHP